MAAVLAQEGRGCIWSLYAERKVILVGWLVVRIIVIMIMNCSMYWGVTFGPFCIQTLYICPLNEFSDVATNEMYHYSCHLFYCWINMLTVCLIVYGYGRWAFWLNRYPLFWNRWNCILKGSPPPLPPLKPLKATAHMTQAQWIKLQAHLSILRRRRIKNWKLTIQGVDR